jgi:hypothetical protein
MHSSPGTHCTGGWVGARVGLDTEARGKKSFVSAGDGTPVVQSVVRHHTNWATPAHITLCKPPVIGEQSLLEENKQI